MNKPATRGNALAYSATVLVTSLVVMSGVGTFYTNRRIEEYNTTLTSKLVEQQAKSDARFCELLALATRVNPRDGSKPSTTRGVEQQQSDIQTYEATVRLFDGLGCKR